MNRYQKNRNAVTMDGCIAELSTLFSGVKDHRAKNACHKLRDILMTGYCIFALKKPSLLGFEQQTTMEKENLKNIYGITQLCSDTTIRETLDAVNPAFLRKHFATQFQTLERTGILRDYQFKIGQQSYLIATCDGTQYFSSKKIHCDCCCQKKHQDGTVTYHHNLLCTALVHPSKREVFVLDAEPIVRQDGCSKQDCELNGAKRLQTSFNNFYEDYKGKYRFLFVEDALYSNLPHIEDIVSKGHSYIIGVTPDGHKPLFAYIAGKRKRGELKQHLQTETKGKKTIQHKFEFINHVRLNGQETDTRVNFIQYTQTVTNEKGVVQTLTFSWVTDILLNRFTVFPVMQAARARWKIENETFNSLKNLGYHFEHNYEHGKDHLSTVFAYLMLTAFCTDQIVQYCCHIFKEIEKNIITKIKLWQTIISIFTTQIMTSMEEIYRTVAKLYGFEIDLNSS